MWNITAGQLVSIGPVENFAVAALEKSLKQKNKMCEFF